MKIKLRRSLILTLALLAAISLSACGAQKTVTEQEKFTVTRGDVTESVNADGTLSLPQDRLLAFGINGKIDQMNVTEGDKVTKGKVLARLESGSLERAVKTAELAVQSAQADLQQAQLSIKTAENDLSQATDNYRKITYPYTYSTFALDIPVSLGYINDAQQQVGVAQDSLQPGLTFEQVGEISRQLRQAQDNLTNARERLARGTGPDVFGNQVLTVKDFWTLRTLQLQMDKTQIAVDNAKSVAAKAALAIDKANYDVATAQDTLDQAIIAAPFDGVIAKVNFKAGEVLSQLDYGRPILEVIDPTQIELTVKVDEIDVPSVKIGQDATISLDALPSTKLNGKVTFISPVSTVEGGVVLYQVKIAFVVPEEMGLKSGMSATADIVITQHSNVLLLPARAISQDISGKSTVKLLVNGQVQETSIVTGISDSFRTEIISGLKEGDTVVIERQVQGGTSGFFG